jgi:hypothetical protein
VSLDRDKLLSLAGLDHDFEAAALTALEDLNADDLRVLYSLGFSEADIDRFKAEPAFADNPLTLLYDRFNQRLLRLVTQAQWEQVSPR